MRTFKAVAELGSLSKASDRLRIAQPALSRHIKLLEHELRTELFIRNGRGMQLTSAGCMLLERTAGLVRQMEQVRDDIQSFSASCRARRPGAGAYGQHRALGPLRAPRSQ
ncbi:LysR family transcriptional regulator [Pseudoroseomonas wenyumeiae]